MKKLFSGITLLLLVILLNPITVSAKSVKCSYLYNDKELDFIIDGKDVKLPFKDGDNFNNKTWYNSNNLESDFYASAHTSSGSLVCPTLTVEESDLFNTVFLNVKDEVSCNGKCTKINAITNSVDTRVGSSVGKYNSSSYFTPYFRKVNNTYEWSIDGVNYYSISKNIKLDKKNIISVDKSFVKNIFTNSDDLVNIYRCVREDSNKYIYKLTNYKSTCTKDDISEVDGQAIKANSYNGAQGAGESENCKNTVLGDPNVDSSTAWLLQKIFDYIKILGPVIVLIMSMIDFAKALIQNDDEAMQKNYRKLFLRLIFAILLFLVPTLTMFLLEVFDLVGESTCVLE